MIEYAKRSEYTVIQDFEYPIYLPLNDTLVMYKKGSKVNLRDDSKLTKEWLARGYVEKD